MQVGAQRLKETETVVDKLKAASLEMRAEVFGLYIHTATSPKGLFQWFDMIWHDMFLPHVSCNNMQQRQTDAASEVPESLCPNI